MYQRYVSYVSYNGHTCDSTFPQVGLMPSAAIRLRGT